MRRRALKEIRGKSSAVASTWRGCQPLASRAAFAADWRAEQRELPGANQEHDGAWSRAALARAGDLDIYVATASATSREGIDHGPLTQAAHGRHTPCFRLAHVPCLTDQATVA
jgi:hypothetical protein